MSKKEKVIVTLSVFCMVLTVLVGYTYSLWTVSKTQTGMNVIGSNCLNIIFTEADDIELTNTYPMLDSEGLQTQPYTFTIENTCDTYANYQINLETFDVASGKTRMPDDYIKANLKLGNGTKISDVLNSDIEVDPTIEGATNAYKLGVGTLKGKSTKTYNLRLWMDERITQDDENATNSSFKGKVSIQFTAALDPFAGAGTLKRAPTSSPTEFWAYRDNITEVEFQNKMEPIVDAIESWDVSSTNDGSVMAYMINQGTEETPEYKVYIQGRNGVRANPNSSHLFKEFKKLKEIKGLEYFDTSNALNMSGMFYVNSSLIQLNLSTFDTSNVTDMSNMFYDCSNLESLDLSDFDTSNLTTTKQMFTNCKKLTKLNLSTFDTSNVTNMYNMFYNCSKLEELDVSSFDTSNVEVMVDMFYRCSKLKEIDVSNFDTSNVTNMSSMFYGCSSLENLDVSNFDTSNVTNMNSTFADCYALTSLDISNFNTSKVTVMGAMFTSCSMLEELDVSNFDTSNVTSMYSMFSSCSKLKDLDVSNFDTSNVTTMSNMFSNCIQLEELDVSSFDTSNVTNMSSMFQNCPKLEELDVSNFDTSNVTNMYNLFDDCQKITTLDLNNWDTSNVTDMGNMFNSTGGNNSEFILDLSNFDTSKVTNMFEMFANHKKLVLTLGNKFDTTNVTSMNALFYNNTSLTVNNLDVVNTLNVEKFDYVSGYTKYGLFQNCKDVNLTFTILTNSVTYIANTFSNAATMPGSQITINYTSENEALVDQMIATKSANSNVVKGIQVTDYTVSLDNSYSTQVNLSSTSACWGKTITLTPTQSNKLITSFKVNGTLINGDSFTMPKSNVTITDVVIIDGAIVESEHKPYANNINNEIYYENTFEGATSITVELTYQTQGTFYDWVYLYTSPTAIYQNKKYGTTTLKTETITIDGNYLKITFTTNGSGNDYYGFKAIVIPNYD